MITEFEYEIKVVDNVNNCVVVLFKKAGFPDFLCSVPSPEPGKDLYEVLRDYAPFSLWGESNAGTVSTPAFEIETPPEAPEWFPEPIIKLVGISR
jgi:hypothetical protein